jgi:hypothetical protein
MSFFLVLPKKLAVYGSALTGNGSAFTTMLIVDQKRDQAK